jgi:two-component system chemotaxis response regulator CheB
MTREENTNPITVLVVDDSAFMRNAIKRMLSSDCGIKVIGAACDGVEALQKIASLKPDVVTLDIEMPRMDGIETLRNIMEKMPLPVIMVSSLTTEGARVTLDALDIGAVDFIPKNLSDLSINIVKIEAMLVEKIKQFGKRKMPFARKRAGVPAAVIKKMSMAKYASSGKMTLVAIGASTGGPKALQSVVPLLPKDFNLPVVIAQHMPPNFTGPFAERLNHLSKLTVKEAKDGDKITPGTVYIAPGIGHMSIEKAGMEKRIRISENSEYIYRPSADLLMLSAAELYPGSCLGVILTGMGNDGLKGMTAIKKSGGRTISQDEDTCVIYGMPKAVVDAGMADKIVPLEEVAGEILNSV